MSDHERVIKGLECCLNGPMKCGECPYESDSQDVRCAKELRTEATALLWEREPAYPMRVQKSSVNPDGSITTWAECFCSGCGGMIARGDSPHYPHCMWCGKPMNWDKCLYIDHQKERGQRRMSNAMCNFREGQYIIYQNGDSFEIGKIKRLTPSGAFVWYTNGDTAAKTPYDCMHPLVNAYVIGETGLGGAMT